MSCRFRRNCELRSSSWKIPWPRFAKSTRCCALSLSRTWQPMSKQVPFQTPPHINIEVSEEGEGFKHLLMIQNFVCYKFDRNQGSDMIYSNLRNFIQADIKPHTYQKRNLFFIICWHGGNSAYYVIFYNDVIMSSYHFQLCITLNDS